MEEIQSKMEGIRLFPLETQVGSNKKYSHVRGLVLERVGLTNQESCDKHYEQDNNQVPYLIADESRDECILELQKLSADLKRDQKCDDFSNALSILDHKNQNVDSSTLELKTWERPQFARAIEGAFIEFLRLHHCQPLLDKDDDSLSHHSDNRAYPQIDAGEGWHNVLDDRRKTQSEGKTVAWKDCIDFDEKEYMKVLQDKEASDALLNSMRNDLDRSQKLNVAFEKQLCMNIPTHTLNAQIESQRRDLETLSVDKKLLEVQLEATQEQLFKAKQDAIKTASSMKSILVEKKKLEDNVKKLEIDIEGLKEKIVRMEMMDERQRECHYFHGNEKAELEATVHHLRINLSAAHTTIKRIEKDRSCEKKQYHRMKEMADNEKSNIDHCLKKEVEKNMEVRRKYYILEQKLQVAKKKELGLKSELYKLKEDIAQKDLLYAGLISQHDQFNTSSEYEPKDILDVNQLQKTNDSLNNELAMTITENIKLREELEQMRKKTNYDSTRLQSVELQQFMTSNWIDDKSIEFKEEYYFVQDNPSDKMRIKNLNTSMAENFHIPQSEMNEFPPRTADSIAKELSTFLTARNRFNHLHSEFVATSARHSSEIGDKVDTSQP